MTSRSRRSRPAAQSPAALVLAASLLGCPACAAPPPQAPPPVPSDTIHHITRNVRTSFSPTVDDPRITRPGFVHPLASVIGNVELGAGVFVAPGASIRGDEGQPLHIGAGSNVQDGVVVHALETFDGHAVVDANLVTVNGRRYAVYIGDNVSLAHQSQVHGPASVGDNTFVGMQSLVFRAEVGDNCVLEPRALVMGVRVAPGRYVPAGQVVRTQEEADALPVIDAQYPLAKINDGVLQVNHELADGYGASFGAPR